MQRDGQGESGRDYTHCLNMLIIYDELQTRLFNHPPPPPFPPFSLYNSFTLLLGIKTLPSSILISICASADWPSLHGILRCQPVTPIKKRMGEYKLAMNTCAKGQTKPQERFAWHRRRKKLKKNVASIWFPPLVVVSRNSGRQSGSRLA